MEVVELAAKPPPSGMPGWLAKVSVYAGATATRPAPWPTVMLEEKVAPASPSSK